MNRRVSNKEPQNDEGDFPSKFNIPCSLFDIHHPNLLSFPVDDLTLGQP